MPLLIALHLCIFWMTFNFTSCLMADSYIASELGGSADISTYGVAFFGLGNACVLPLVKLVEGRIGRINGLLISLFCFMITLILSSIAPTFFVFVLIRFLSGASSALLYPLSSNFIKFLISPGKQESSIAFLAFLGSIIPVLGASFGGWMAYDFEWRWIFILQLPFLLLTFLVLYRYRTMTFPSTKLFFDKTGFFFYILSICSFSIPIFLGQQLDWFRSPIICALFIIAAISIPFFILWELNQKEPFLDLRLFCNPTFFICIFSNLFLFSAYFGTIVLLSLWLHLDVNYTPDWIALLLLQMFFVGSLLFLFMVRWLKKSHAFLPVLFSIFAFSVSCFYTANFNVEINFGRIAVSRILAGFGFAFFFYPLFKICLASIPAEKVPEGTSFFSGSRLLSCAIGAVAYQTMWIRRKVFYHERLGSSLTEYSEQTRQTLSWLEVFHKKSGRAANELLENALDRQATALALADCFYFMGWVLMTLFFIVLVFAFRKWLLKKQEKATC